MLPGLGTVLDVEAFAAALRCAVPGKEIEACEPLYLKYKPQTNCVAGYRLRIEGAVAEIYAKAYPLSADEQLSRATRKPGIAGPLGLGRLLMEENGIVISCFPNDGKVRTLAALATETTRRELMGELAPSRPELWEGQLEKIAYKAERRYVGRWRGRQGAQAALKVYTQHGYAAARQRAQMFRPREVLQLAPELGRSDRQRTLAFEWSPGRSLYEALPDSQLDLEAVVRIGRALAELHAQRPEGLPQRDLEHERDMLLQEAAWLSWVCPRLGRRSEPFARMLAHRLLESPAASCPIHGDFHSRQVLVNGSEVTLIDFDEAVWSDPAADLGNFVAHLERAVVRGLTPASQVEPMREALWEGYRVSNDNELGNRVRLYTAIGLFRLAPRCFRYREPDWPERAEALLDRAAAYAA